MGDFSSIRIVAQDAQWLAHRYDPGHDAFHLRHAPRALHGRVPFLTDEYLGECPNMVLRRSDVMAVAPSPAPLHFIFHSAYCCSTLLAAAFDLPGVAMGLKEPVLLNDIIGWRHGGSAAGPQIARVLDEGMRLLARPFAPEEAVIVKPSNVVNPLIPAIMGLRADASALFLHAPLEAYLASIARKGMWGRLWVRDLFGKLLREGMVTPLGIDPDDYLGLTDIQVAAVGWLAQQRQFGRLAEQLGGRVATLDSETLIARPQESISALARLFRLSLDEMAAAAIANGPVFARDAKDGSAFAPGQRTRNAESGIALYRDELEKVLVWARKIADNIGIGMALPRPLIA